MNFRVWCGFSRIVSHQPGAMYQRSFAQRPCRAEAVAGMLCLRTSAIDAQPEGLGLDIPSLPSVGYPAWVPQCQCSAAGFAASKRLPRCASRLEWYLDATRAGLKMAVIRTASNVVHGGAHADPSTPGSVPTLQFFIDESTILLFEYIFVLLCRAWRRSWRQWSWRTSSSCRPS